MVRVFEFKKNDSINYSIFNIRELLLGHIILQGTCTQDGLIERPLLLPFVKKKCCTYSRIILKLVDL